MCNFFKMDKYCQTEGVTYNDIMPTKIYDKIKVTGIPMSPNLQR